MKQLLIVGVICFTPYYTLGYFIINADGFIMDADISVGLGMHRSSHQVLHKKTVI